MQRITQPRFFPSSLELLPVCSFLWDDSRPVVAPDVHSGGTTLPSHLACQAHSLSDE